MTEKTKERLRNIEYEIRQLSNTVKTVNALLDYLELKVTYKEAIPESIKIISKKEYQKQMNPPTQFNPVVTPFFSAYPTEQIFPIPYQEKKTTKKRIKK